MDVLKIDNHESLEVFIRPKTLPVPLDSNFDYTLKDTCFPV